MEIEMNTIQRLLETYCDEPIDSEDMKEVLKMAVPQNFKKGDLILGMGEKLKQVYYIISGIVRSYYLDYDGNDVTKYFMIENNFCMADSLVSLEPSICNFEVLEDCTMVSFDSKVLKEVIMKRDYLRKVYIGALEESLKYKINRENSFLMKSATERYLDFKREHPNLEKRVNQSHIASYLGITPVSLSRIRRSIRAEK